jgi:anti-sigma regulatory factor (Ser/Thr protein kinase)
MAYGPLPDSVPTARGRTKAVLLEWGAARDGLDDILLVVTELVTNAVNASRALPGSRPVRVWVCFDAAARLLIEVGDESLAQPVRVPRSDDALSGRGLHVVDDLSSGWGWFPATGHGLAKVVWADIRAELQPMQYSAVSGMRQDPPDAGVLRS